MRVRGTTVSGKISTRGPVAAAAAAVCFIALCLFDVSPAAALDPPAPEPARVVFSNGGRIVQVNANGTGRRVLTNRNRKPKNGRYGHANPEVSPDGTMMVFTNGRRVNRWMVSRDIVVSRADGTGQKSLFRSTKRLRYSAATWLPDGAILVAYFKVGNGAANSRSGLIRIEPDGSGRRVVLELKPRKQGRWYTRREVSEPKVSPDGEKAMVVIGEDTGGLATSPDRLVIVNLATGKQLQIAEEAFSGDWSPDGASIVFAAARPGDDQVCSWQQFYCVRTAVIKVARADGKAVRRLVSGKVADQRSPSFSPDGMRILFQSNRNLPGGLESSEIYSVRLDGKCLTWLTNGTPASITPSWVPGAATSEPGSCGPLSLPLLPEVAQPEPKWKAGSLWAGGRLGNILYSGGLSPRTGSEFEYLDCATYRFADCGRPFILWTVDICETGGSLVDAFGHDQLIRRERGVPVFRSRTEIGAFTLMLTGRSYVVVWGGSKRGRKEIAALRPFGAERATGDLPKPLFPRQDLRRMKKVVRVVKKAGSVRAASGRLAMKPRKVRMNLKMYRTLKRIGNYGSVNCPAKKRKAKAAVSIRNGFPGA